MTDNPLAEWLRARERDHRQEAPNGADGSPSEQAREDAFAAGARPPGPIEPPSAPWDDLPAEKPARPRRRWMLFTVALVPWVATGVLVASLGTGDGAVPPRGADTTVEERGAPRETPTASAVPSAQAAAAVLAVRTAAVASPVTDSGEEDPLPRRYIDLAVAEGVTPLGETTVVTVAATVLEGTAEEWRRARPARFGVAVRDTGDGAVAVGDPWPLPNPPSAEELSWEEVESEAEPFEAALVAAGYDRLHGVELSRSQTVPGVVRVDCRAVAPGDEVERRHAVWVADEPRPVVLGAPEAGNTVRQPETSAR